MRLAAKKIDAFRTSLGWSIWTVFSFVIDELHTSNSLNDTGRMHDLHWPMFKLACNARARPGWDDFSSLKGAQVVPGHLTVCSSQMKVDLMTPDEVTQRPEAVPADPSACRPSIEYSNEITLA